MKLNWYIFTTDYVRIWLDGSDPKRAETIQIAALSSLRRLFAGKIEFQEYEQSKEGKYTAKPEPIADKPVKASFISRFMRKQNP